MASKIKLNNNQGDTITLEHSDTISSLGSRVIPLDNITHKVGTIAELRAMTERPEFVYVEAYDDSGSTYGAFGSHFFKRSLVVVADNGGTVIQSVNDTYELQYDGAVNVKWFGAVGNGIADDTLAFNRTSSFSHVLVPKSSGHYMIDSTVNGTKYGWTLETDTIIDFEKGAVLKSITNSDDSYRVVYMNGVSNIVINNPSVIGDLLTHTGTTGEGGHSVGIYNSSNIIINNGNLKDAWGVALAIVWCQNIQVYSTICDNGRQNSCAIVAGKNITMTDCTYKNAGVSGDLEIDPSAGLDIEPNQSSDYMENINIINPRTYDNLGNGIDIALNEMAGATTNVSINIENHKDLGSKNGIRIARIGEGTVGSIYGSININNSVYELNKQCGILVSNYSATKSPKVTINNPTVISPNTSSDAKFYSGILLEREVAATSTDRMGNIYINRPYVKDNRVTKLMTFGIECRDEKSIGFDNCHITEPLKIEGTSNPDVNYKASIYDGVLFADTRKIISANFTSSRALASRAYGRLSNTAFANFILDTSGNLYDSEILFVHNTTAGLRITPDISSNILPLSLVDGKYIQTLSKGGSMTLKRLNADSWIVVNQTGTWTVEP